MTDIGHATPCSTSASERRTPARRGRQTEEPPYDAVGYAILREDCVSGTKPELDDEATLFQCSIHCRPMTRPTSANLDADQMPHRLGQPDVSGEQRTVERLGQDHVGGVVRGHVAA